MVVVQASYDFGPEGSGLHLLRAGWCVPAADGVWSDGHESTLEVPVKPGNGAARLELVLDSQERFAMTRYRTIEVRVNGVKAAVRRWGGKGRLKVALPAYRAGGRARISLRCRLQHDDGGKGVRLCGLDVLRDTHPALPPPARAMTEFKFGWNETTETLLQAGGWGSPEDAFVWAIGAESILTLPVPPTGSPMTVLIDMRPHTRDGTPSLQRVALFADGVQVAALHLWERLCVAVDVHPAEGQTQVQLCFRNADADFRTSDPYFHFGKPFAWALGSLRILPALPRYYAATRPRVPGALADGTMQKMVEYLTQKPAADIAACYESLGNGCELGYLQRDFERGRPSLLQYAAVRQRELIEGLFVGFNGVGRGDRLSWDVRRTEDETWRLIESSYGLSSATVYNRFVPPPARGFREAAGRLPRLADKVMEDIAAADKIFLARFSETSGVEAARAVLAALRYRGEADLVWLVADGHVPGSAERLEAGLIRGHLEEPRSGRADSLDTLMSVLANAFVLLRQAQRMPRHPADRKNASATP